MAQPGDNSGNPPTINIDPNAAPLDKLMSGLNQGGVVVTDGESQKAFVHHSGLDQFLKDNPTWEKGTVFSKPDGTLGGVVKASNAGNFRKQNPGWTPGLPSQKLPSPALNPPSWIPTSALDVAAATVGPNPVGTFLQQHAENARQQAQREANLAYGPEAGNQDTLSARIKAVPSSLYHGLGSLAMETEAGASGVLGGIVNDPKVLAILAASIADPAIAAAYFGTQGAGSLLGVGGSQARSSVKQAIQHPTPENIQQALFDVSMVLGVAEGAHGGPPEAPNTATRPTGTTGPLAIPGAGAGTALDVARQAARPVTDPIAEAFRTSAERQEQRVLTQGGGTRKEKATAAKVAPEMARRGVIAASREGLEQKSAAQVEASGKQLEQFYENLPEGAKIPTQPLLDHFEQAKQDFVAPDTGAVLDQNAIDKIDGLKQVVEKFGPEVTVNDIVKLRRLWDDQIAAAQPGHVLPTLDESTAIAIKREAADAIRAELAKQFPDLDKVNKEFSFWKSVNTVMSATNLRKGGHAWLSLTDLLAGTAGGSLGGQLFHTLGSGVEAAGVGIALAKAMRSTAWETVSAATKYRIADFLADGKVKEAAEVATKAVAPPKALGPEESQQTRLPFGPSTLWDIRQTPTPEQAAPPLALPPGQYEMPPSPLGPVFRSRQPQLGKGAEPPVIGPARQLGPATPHQLPASPINPFFPRIGARPEAEGASAGLQVGGAGSLAEISEQHWRDAIERDRKASEQAGVKPNPRAAVLGAMRDLGFEPKDAQDRAQAIVDWLGAQGPTPPADKSLQNVPIGTLPKDLKSVPLGGEPTTVGGRATVETAKADNIFWDQAKQALGPKASFSEISAKALKLKADALQERGVSPSGQPDPFANTMGADRTIANDPNMPVHPSRKPPKGVIETIPPASGTGDLEARPLVAPREAEAEPQQMDLGLGLPRQRGEAFFSKAEQLAEAKLPKSGSGDSFLATLRNNGVKAEEISDLGLDDFAGQEKVTKQEFLNAIQSRRPQLEQTVLHGPDETKYEQYTTPGWSGYREILTTYPQSDAGAAAASFKEEADMRERDMNDEIDRHNNASPEDQAKWPDDYFEKEREALRTLRAQQRAAENEARATDFQGGHWTDKHPNVLMHSRESDHVTTDGMPVTHVQEWQSDLHQKGRDVGYRKEPLRQLPEGLRTKHMDGGGYMIVNERGQPFSMGADDAIYPSAQSQEDAIDAFLSRYNAQQGVGSGAPNAPFKKAHTELNIKDSIRRAIEDGKQGMTWDTGQTQADRYDLRKQINRVEYDPDSRTLMAYDHEGSRVIHENATIKELPDYIGKELAQKLQDRIDEYHPASEDDYQIRRNEDGMYEVVDQNGETGEAEFRTQREAEKEVRYLVDADNENQDLPALHNVDMEVGGEGMKGFYDKIVPDFVRKYTKKWGGTVDTAELPTGEETHEHEYVGPELTKDQVEQKWKESARQGPQEWKETEGGAWAWFQGGQQISGAFHDVGDSQVAARTISNDPVERQWKSVLDDMNRGVPFKQTMANNWNLAEDIGGRIQTNGIPQTTTVHRLNFTPEMIRAIKEEGQPLYAKKKGAAPTADDVTNVVSMLQKMESSVDPGDEATAAHIKINDAGQKFLSHATKSNWLGINWRGVDGPTRAALFRRFADNIEKANYPGGAKAATNLRALADQIEQVHTANAEPGAGHAGIPIVRDEGTVQHERDIHGGQRTFDPEGDVTNFTNVEKTMDHPAVPIAQAALAEAYGGPLQPAHLIAEMQAHILDGSHKELGLTREQAVDFIEHSLNVLAEHHGPDVMANPPRLGQRYLQAMREYTGETNAGEPTESAQPQAEAPAQTAEAQRGAAGVNPAEAAAAGQPAQVATQASDRGAGAQGVVPGFLRQRGAADLESRKLPSGEQDRISTRRPTAISSKEDPLKQDLQINTQAIRDGGNEAAVAKLVRRYPGLNLPGRPAEALDSFVAKASNNLLWLHDNFPEAWRNQAMHWYDGAHKLAHEWAQRYGLTPPQAAGVIATLSPQKDWNMNVSLAQRLIEAHQQRNDLPFSFKMKAMASKLAEDVPSLRPHLSAIMGKKYGDLKSPNSRALWLRLYDQAHNPSDFTIHAPDGSPMGIARTQKGEPAKVTWQSTPAIAKALAILGDPSRENISNNLGLMHKVRSFFNNIISPNSKSGDVTIDTHAVAAGLLRALAAKDTEVNHNFDGGPNSSVSGAMGTYGLYADAYRDAAAKRGLLPRQMQSITWEAIRSLFPKRYKQVQANKAIIDGIWKEHADGDLTLGQARKQITKAAGGFKPPDWAGGSGAGGHEEVRPAAEPQDVLRGRVYGRPPGGTVGGGRGNVAAPVSTQERKDKRKASAVVPSFLRRPFGGILESRTPPPPSSIPKFLRQQRNV